MVVSLARIVPTTRPTWKSYPRPSETEPLSALTHDADDKENARETALPMRIVSKLTLSLALCTLCFTGAAGCRKSPNGPVSGTAPDAADSTARNVTPRPRRQGEGTRAPDLQYEQLNLLATLLDRLRFASAASCAEECSQLGGQCRQGAGRFLCVVGCYSDGDCPRGMGCSCMSMKRCSYVFLGEQAPRLLDVCVERSPSQR